jgi:hypothetical protein
MEAERPPFGLFLSKKSGLQRLSKVGNSAALALKNKQKRRVRVPPGEIFPNYLNSEEKAIRNYQSYQPATVYHSVVPTID